MATKLKTIIKKGFFFLIAGPLPLLMARPLRKELFLRLP